MYNQASDIKKFKVALYAKMREALYNSSRNMCYAVANEAQCFVHNHHNKDPELIKIANNMVVAFLDDLEHKLFNFIEHTTRDLSMSDESYW